MRIEAMRQAIEAWDACGRYPDATSDIERLDVAINALRAALSQQPVTRLPEDVVIGHVTLCKGSNISLLIDHAKRLNADVERLEAHQPATGEPTPQDVVDAFEKARAGSDKPVGILRGVRAVMRLLPDLKPAPDPIAPDTPERN